MLSYGHVHGGKDLKHFPKMSCVAAIKAHSTIFEDFLHGVSYYQQMLQV